MRRAARAGSSTRRANRRAASRGVLPSSDSTDSTRSTAARLSHSASVCADSASAKRPSGVAAPGTKPSKPPSARCWRTSHRVAAVTASSAVRPSASSPAAANAVAAGSRTATAVAANAAMTFDEPFPGPANLAAHG